jgi:TonB-linked SusC/RagA family outer membrane protein
MKKSLLLAWLIIFISVPTLAFSQSRQVTGTVTDEYGETLPAVSVVQKGTQNGTTTDSKGFFSITVTGTNPVLVFSFAGRQTREVAIGSRNQYDVTLNPNGEMSEVVVTAFGIKKQKRTLGYSTQEVSGDDLMQTRQPNLVNALQGRVAGVQINSTGGAPGQGASIIIRGVKSLDPSKDNQPLFVIDGVVMDNSTNVVGQQAEIRGMSNRAADINPDDIETISILKGGAATALYGQAGSNGVVVITTKSGRAGRMRVGLTTTYGISNVNKFPDVQMRFTQGYKGVYDPSSFWPTWGPTVEAARALDPTHPAEIYNHYARGYEQGNQFRTTLNLSGGTENSMLSSSFSYFKQNGTIPFTDYKNISARVSGQLKFSSKLKMSPSVIFTNSGGYRYNADRYNESLTYWSPRWDVMDYINPDGTMKTYGNNNPVYGAATNRFKDDVNRIVGNVLFSYTPVSWASVDYRLGLDRYTDARTYTAPGPKGIPGEIPYEDNGLGFVNEYNIQNRILNSNLIVTLQKDWSSKFSSTLRLGNDVRDQYYKRLSAEGDELDIPDLLTLNNTKNRTASEYEENYRIVSFFGELQLGYNNYLFLSVTGRNDQSSALAEGLNSYFYPSVSLSYVFSDMFTMPAWWSYGKLRASYAQIGKDTDPYRINTYYGSSVLSSTGQVLWTRQNSQGEQTLRPEKTTTLELGTELGFLNSRLGLDFTVYKLNSKDQIIPVSISPTTGFTQLYTNAGEIENKGIEVTLKGTPVNSKDFTWNINLNYSRNRNKVLSIKEGLTELVVGSQFGYAGSTVTMKYVPGYAVGNLYGSSYLRYYGNEPDDKVTLRTDLPLVIASTGSNAGFPVRDGTQRLLGNSQPKWIGGLENSFRYKSFSLSFLFDAQQGMKKYNQLGNFMAAFGIAKYTENRDQTVVFEGVLPNGTPNTQVVYYGQDVGPDGRNYGDGYYRNIYRGVSENFVEDASWVRLRNASLSYNLPNGIFKGTFIRDASVSLTGNNLLLFTDYSGFDPESSSFNSGSIMGSGFAGFTYPASRTFLFTVNVNF